uniref:RNA helicase n=1 Tax=Caenorhabditis tropicalis TaxID=1561998 RepID=A0A1I7TGB8_9PELO
MSPDDIVKKKKKSVKFAVEEPPKAEEKPKKAKNAKKIEVSVDLSGNEAKGRKRKQKQRKSQAEKRQKLMENLVAPQVDEIDFEPEHKTFTDFGLDERILKSIGELGWEKATQVQESLISLALENKNIMGRARTGSGKTGAFLIPLVQKLITESKTNDGSVGPSAIVIAPTKELITQIYKLFVKLSQALPFLQAINLCDINEEEDSVWTEDHSHVVVATPGKLLRMCALRPEYCSLVNYLVMDEADLLLSFGYEEEMIKIRAKLPPTYQCVMTSATLKDDMTTLKKLFMTGPVVTIKLTEGDLPNSDQLTQYQLTCASDEERFAILVAMFKLKLIVGRSILFVNSIDRCYKLMLILRVFGLKSCILNSAMPANSRCHVINQFNEGAYQIVIASDVSDADGTKLKEQLTEPQGEEGGEKSNKKEKKTGGKKLDKESGVSRGIDFHHVSNVVNFDFPETTDAYIHRVGRTARGFNKGTALSFCTPQERPHLEVIQEEINKQMGRRVLQPYEFRIKELDTFLLRTREALAKCTKGVIKKARLKEIRQELMRSANLQTFFAKNEREKLLMQTDCHPVTLKLNSPAIADVTTYMVPEALRGMDFSAPKNRNHRYNMGQKHRQKLKHKFQKKGKDPLKTFKI